MHYSTGAYDRRVDSAKSDNRFAIFGLSDAKKTNKLIRVSVDKEGILSELLSDEFRELLLSIVIVSDEVVLTLRPNETYIHNASTLACKHKVEYNDILKGPEVSRLSYYGSTVSHSSYESSSCLGPFIVTTKNIDKLGAKSVNDENLSEDGSNWGFNTWIARFKLNAAGDSIEF